MKKIIFYSLTGLFSVMVSCDDFLDKESYTDYDKEYVTKTREGIYGLLNGTYDMMSHQYYYGCNMYAYEASKGPDFFVRVSSGGSFERENRYAESTSSSGSAENMWTQLYMVIRNATTLLEYIHDVEDLDVENKRILQGEAVTLRGLAYFDLMRLFAYPPLFSIPGQDRYDEKYKWGIPIVEDMEMINNIYKYDVRRQTAEDMYKYIEGELLAGKTLLEGTQPQKGHVNYTAACALLTRLYLYMNRWDDAIEMGEEAVMSAQGIYSLIPYENYKTTYYKPFTSENIWELTYSLTDNVGGNGLNNLVRKPTYNNPGMPNDGLVSENIGYAAFGLSKYGREVLSDLDDVRSYLICELGIIGKDYKGCRKYVGETYHFVYNVPVVRLPEVYLSLSEAYLESGNDVANAEKYYKMLREARTKDNNGFVGTSKKDQLEEILVERKRELMLEGHTFWDYFRRGTSIVREQIENSNKPLITFGSRTQVVYPIPLKELEANKAIRDQQNPGYEAYDQVYGED
jgi:tetratricopeptide (TPR) repeat protein